MSNSLIEQFTCTGENRYLGPAEILEVDLAGQRVRLRLGGSEDDIGVWARIAIASADPQICKHDEALVIGDDPREMYVIGLLRKANGPGDSAERPSHSDAAYATASGSPKEGSVRVFSRHNELLFEYDETNHRARVNVDNGDIEFVAKNGSIAFSAERDVFVHGQSVCLSSGSTFKLNPAQANGELIARGIELRGPALRVSAERGDIQIAEAGFSGRRFLASFREGKLIVERFESAFQTLTEKARNAFRAVEQLSQLRAARIRTLVESTYFFKARKAFIKSDEDYKIRARTIHLG